LAYHIFFQYAVCRIREMPVEHMDLPAQAMACIISGLEPADIEFGWNPSDGALLAEIATNKVLHAVVKVWPLSAFMFILGKVKKN